MLQRLNNRWASLTQPASGIDDPQDLRNATLILSLLVALFPIVVIVVLLWLLIAPNKLFVIGVGVSILVGIAAIYVLARTTHFMSAVWIALLAVIGTSFISYIVYPSTTIPLAFIVLSLFISSVMMSLATTVALTLFTIIGLLILTQTNAVIPLIGVISLIAVMEVAFVVVAMMTEREKLAMERRTYKIVHEEREHLEDVLEEEKSKALAAMIADASHELKTPLSVINTNTYVLQKLVKDEKHLESVQTIADQTQLLHDLINDLFVMSRLDGGRKLSIHRSDIATLIQNIDQKIRPMAIAKQVTLTLDLANDVPKLPVDTREIERALLNIMSNALRYTPMEGSVLVKLRREKQYACVTVSDTGIGIDEKDLPRIFDRFYRVPRNNSTTDQGGSGLGLAITKKIIEAHGGNITVKSKRGKGTVFQLRLPLLTD